MHVVVRGVLSGAWRGNFFAFCPNLALKRVVLSSQIFFGSTLNFLRLVGRLAGPQSFLSVEFFGTQRFAR